MARKRRARPYVNLRAGGNGTPTLINYGAPGGPRMTTFDAQGRPVRETVEGGEFALPQVRGLRIRRGVRTNYGVRDLVVDQQGNTLAAIAGGSSPQLRMSTTGPDGGRRLVVGRGSATTGGGAAPTTPGADAFTVDSGQYGFNPNAATLDKRWGAGNYSVVKVGNKWVVRTKAPSPAGPAPPPDPYAAYDAYPSIKNYLMGMDSTYNNFQNYLTNTYNPQITAASQGLTAQRLAAGNVYNSAIQNYAGSAGNVASAITTPQVAGATGGAIVAPNQNALGAAQSMAATATAARNIDAGARTALGGLEAEKMGQSFLSSGIGYGAGLLNQYGQKRVAERLKMDQWIEEQKAAAEEAKAKQDLELMKMDQSMINSLIVSGDRNAARQVQMRGQDIQADNAAAAREDKYSANALQSAGWIPLPKGAGRKGLNVRTSTDGVVMYKPKGGSGGGGSGGGSTPTDSQRAARINDFKGKWSPGQVDPATGVPRPATWGNGQTKFDAAAVFVKSNISLFPGLKKGNRTGVNEFLILAGVRDPKVRKRIIDSAIQLIARG